MIDSSLREAIERKDVPGVVALVTDRERVLYQGAFGVADVSTGRPLAKDSMFRIASMTKPITSVALMQLVEQGRIGLDDPASKYLPELAELKVFESFDAKTGAILWQYPTLSGVNGVPVSFAVDGKQYIAVQSGWGVDAQRMQDRLNLLFPGKYLPVPQGGAVYVFALK